jgi:hypothetical protein
MKKMIVGFLAVFLILTTSIASADHRHRDRDHHRNSNVGGALALGLIVGAIAGSSSRDDRGQYDSYYGSSYYRRDPYSGRRVVIYDNRPSYYYRPYRHNYRHSYYRVHPYARHDRHHRRHYRGR